MTEGEVRLERLLGTVVRDAAGRRIGRIEDMRVGRVRGEWVVTHFLVGPLGALERLRTILRRLTDPRAGLSRLPREALDLSDPRRPRLAQPIRGSK
jgi:hypothetical protein